MTGSILTYLYPGFIMRLTIHQAARILCSCYGNATNITLLDGKNWTVLWSILFEMIVPFRLIPMSLDHVIMA